MMMSEYHLTALISAEQMIGWLMRRLPSRRRRIFVDDESAVGSTGGWWTLDNRFAGSISWPLRRWRSQNHFLSPGFQKFCD